MDGAGRREGEWEGGERDGTFCCTCCERTVTQTDTNGMLVATAKCQMVPPLGTIWTFLIARSE